MARLARARSHCPDRGCGWCKPGRVRPVLLLHGFPQDSREYVRVVEILARSARVIVPDPRGAGGTQASAGRYDAATMKADLLALMDVLGLNWVDLVAHDWSALVGFLSCLAHPQWVSRFVALTVPAAVPAACTRPWFVRCRTSGSSPRWQPRAASGHDCSRAAGSAYRGGCCAPSRPGREGGRAGSGGRPGAGRRAIATRSPRSAPGGADPPARPGRTRRGPRR